MVNASWYQSRALAKTVKDAGQTRRLLALAVIYDGARRAAAARRANARSSGPAWRTPYYMTAPICQGTNS